ncbi:MAG: nucleotidyltransferase family protein [Candidatus Lambdaproteobacteria bacterium]|nr:nucleotidyltransferase family protein [Candidatus Lambdaproteobacteria bacterium]
MEAGAASGGGTAAPRCTTPGPAQIVVQHLSRNPVATPRIEIPHEQIAAFCRKWKIAELALFGSVLREDFRPDSDVDVLVTFAPGGGFTFENRVRMLDELVAILGRPVDVVDAQGLSNPFRRHAILRSKEVVYAA